MMELDLKDCLKVIRKRMRLVIGIVLISCLTTTLVSIFVVEPVYEASTKLIVNKSNEPTGNSQVDINSINTNLRLIDTYKEIIKTPAIMDAVTRQYPEFGLNDDQLIKKIKVSSVNNTQVMTLVVQDHVPVKAVKIVNAVSQTFQQEIAKIMKVDNVSLLNQAKLADDPIPVNRNTKLDILISLIASLMAAIGLSLFLEYMDDTIKTEADVERYLGLPTLSVITNMREHDLMITKSPQSGWPGEDKHVAIKQ